MRLMKLRHVADIRNSNVDKVVVDGEQPIRLCNYVDVYKNDFIEADMDFSAGSATKAEIKAFGLREGDVIITKDSEDRNDIGVPALVRSTAPDLLCGYHLSILRAKKGVAIGPFLFWALLSKPARDAFSNAAYGITRFGMTLGGMKNVVIPLPDLATQRRIADFLDRETARIDRAIEKKQRLVALLGEKFRSDIHDLFESLDARIWRVRHLGNVKNGAGFPVELQGDASNEIPFFKVKHLAKNGLDQRITDSEDTISKEAARTLRAIVFPEGTIVFAKIGAALLLGRFSMLGTQGCIDNNLAAFVVNKQLVDPDYLLLCFERFEMQLMVQPGAVPSLSTERFINQPVPLPSLERQKELVERARKAAQSNRCIMQRTQESITRLKEYRAALITAAVTGQIDVEAYAKSGTTERRLDAIEQEADA